MRSRTGTCSWLSTSSTVALQGSRESHCIGFFLKCAGRSNRSLPKLTSFREIEVQRGSGHYRTVEPCQPYNRIHMRTRALALVFLACVESLDARVTKII